MKNLLRRLEAEGFDEALIAATFGTAPNAESVPIYVRRVASTDPRAVLVQLFVLGEPVRADELPVDAGDLEAAGLVERHGAVVRAPLRLVPYAGLLIAHDADTTEHDPDHVPGMNNATRTLATLTIRRPVDRALDLGTGSGTQALLAARHARSVTATDVNSRALRYAALNARLNGVDLDLREGSWFEPIAGERFDLIVANPPYVISPDTQYVFRDSGLDGDTVSRHVVRGAAAHLREGGHATIMCNWVCRDADETWQPLVEWVAETGCDALLLAHEPVDLFHYAARWNEPLRNDPDAFGEAIERWLDSYEHAGVVGIGIGAIVLRRREGNNWHRGYDLEQPASGAAGEHILRLFASVDAPLGDDDDVLAGSFSLVPGHRLEQRLVYKHEYELSDVTMLLDDGVGLVARVDAAALPALFALDPERPLRQAVTDAADVLPTIRRLYDRGFLMRSSKHTRRSVTNSGAAANPAHEDA
jgi:methylase of polypeptide subunit release factors